jgi:tetratricopeptide (TPR) repeat protein
MKNILFFAALTLLCSCKKYLDVKPDKSQVIPATLSDFQSLFDNATVMNTSSPSIMELASDNMYIIPATWTALTDFTAKNGYIWEKDMFNDNDNNDWSLPYRWPLYANVVLGGLQKITPSQSTTPQWNNLKGAALFYRAHCFYQVAQAFCKPYTASSATTDLGIPLRLTTNIEETSVRSSVQETYDRIISDLTEAAPLLPVVVPYKTRPTKQAAFALLARAYISMEKYDEALTFADSALAIQSAILNYNTLSATAANPVPRFNDETIYHCTMFARSAIASTSTAKVDSILYRQYANNDLRKTLFYKASSGNQFSFSGSYDGTASLFSGLATDEMMLVKAECLARKNNATLAMSVLNQLLVNRYKTGTFVPLVATTSDQALAAILAERRKELAFRALRWTDLRRLNKDPRFAITVTKTINAQVYTLPANDPRYVMPIPDKVISASGMQQNPR